MVLVIFSLLIMALDHRQNHLEGIRSGLSLLIYPLQYVINLPVAASHWVGDSFSSRETLLEENNRLKLQQTLFRARLQKLQSLKAENQRLRELLQSSKKISERVLIGELLAVSLEPFTRQVVINKGSRNDVYLGQPLMDAEGAMGQVVHLGPFSSTAMLITDANHAIPVQVNRNGLRAIALGTGAPDKLNIPYLPISADIVEGDLLTTSGLGGRFPAGYPVAVVTRIVKDPSLPYAIISAMPAARLEQAREVLLIWPTTQHKDEQTTTPQAATGAAQP
ncbi:MAG: rod shape-determining protein MreC [Gammaproteobacteria bacterium]|nr:rod shape-determining protein MreC [Gammaproteobacteria bacterium]